MAGQYTVEYPKDSFWVALEALSEGHQERVLRFMRGTLTQAPNVPQGENLYELHGQQRGIWQYKVSWSMGIRLFYRIDEAAKIVRIETLRQHPSWGRSRDRQNL